MFENKIIIDPKIRYGKPVIKGTRVSTDIILGSLTGGMDVEEVAEEYGVKKEDVLVTIKYATKIMTKEEI